MSHAPFRPTQPATDRRARLDRRGVLRRSALGLATPVALSRLLPFGDVAPARAQADATPESQTVATPVAPTPTDSGYVDIGPLSLYYARYDGGDGTPLLMIHGGLMTGELTFGAMIPHLTSSRTVLTIDLEGHGHTALTERPLSFEQMADDVAALVQAVGLDQVDVFGYSTGGAVTWQLAIRHPDLLRKVIVASTPIKRDGWAPEILAAMSSLNADAAAAMEATPLYQAYVAVAPRPEDWPELVTRVGKLNTGTPYDWSEDVAALDMPVLFIVGDADSVLPEHTVELFRLLGGGVVGDVAPLPASQLAILPGTAHSQVGMRTDELVSLILGFLDAPMPEGA